MDKVKFSIKYKYTIYVLIVCIIISLISIITTSLCFNQILKNHYHHEINSLFNQFKPEIINCIKRLDYTGIEKTLKWFTKFRDINGIILYDSNGNIIIKRGLTKGIKIERNFSNGKLAVYFSKFYINDLKKNLILKVSIIFLLILPIIVMLTFILVRCQLKDIKKLSEIIKNLGNPEFSVFDLNIPKSKDEISQLAKILRNKHFQLIETRKQLYILFKTINQCYNSVVITDINGKILYVNSAFTKNTGYTLKEVLGKKSNILKSGKQSKNFYKKMWNTILNGNIWEGKLINKTKNGKLYIEKMNITPVKNEKDEIQYFIAIKQDITKEVENEKKLLRMEKMKTVEIMASGIAHEINNLLTPIVSYPEILENFIDNKEKLINGLKKIQINGLKISEILLELTALSSNIAIPKQNIDVNKIIIDCLDSNEISELLKEKDIKINLNLSNELNLINCNYFYMYKSLLNLLKNSIEAIKYEGEISINTENIFLEKEIAKKFDILPGEYIKISIKDSGKGISAEDLDRIFEPFFTKKKLGRKSTGVGLTIVWNTVKSHNGGIDVKSDKNGTIFNLYFPVSKKDYKDKINLKKLDKKFSILVVDDEKEQRDLLTEILSNKGFIVDSVGSGEEAIEYIKNTHVDLIILDMVMEPGIDGCETFERIKKIKPQQKAIIVSGMSYSERINKALKIGIKYYIKKPYTIEQLIQIINSAMLD